MTRQTTSLLASLALAVLTAAAGLTAATVGVSPTEASAYRERTATTSTAANVESFSVATLELISSTLPGSRR